MRDRDQMTVETNMSAKGFDASLMELGQIDKYTVLKLVEKGVPMVGQMGLQCLDLEPGRNVLFMQPSALWMRPVDVFSGPTIMAIADIGMYIGIFSLRGFEPMAVTTNLNVNFMSAAKGGNLVAETQIQKCGRRMAFGQVRLWMDEAPERLVAMATCAYALPDKKT